MIEITGPVTGATLEVCAGSVTGAWHLRAGRNNQDGHHVLRRPGYLLAVVCDGCSAARRSELGALLGARWVAATLGRFLEADGDAVGDVPALLLRLHRRLVGALARLARQLAGPGEAPSAVIAEHLLFTVVGALVTPQSSWVFHQGDGLCTWNGRPLEWPHDEAPDYPGYAALSLVDPARPARPPTGFEVLGPLPTGELRELVLATDGALPLQEADQLAGLLHDELPFRNPDGLRRRLARQQRDRERERGQGAQLDDDLTVVAIRRRCPGGVR